MVAEYKRASPSRGVIREDLDVEEVVRQYAAAGPTPLSILTEETWFHGSLDFLTRAAAPGLYPAAPLPLLRKDFIFDSLQVRATAATPASALLLIVRLTPEARLLRQLREEAEGFGLHAVVEIFDAADLRLARESGARIIQVNARDLQTFAVDRAACLSLARSCPPENGEIWVAGQRHQPRGTSGPGRRSGLPGRPGGYGSDGSREARRGPGGPVGPSPVRRQTGPLFCVGGSGQRRT